MRKALIFIFAILVGLIGSTIQAGELINYQGRLTDSDGNPVADNTYQLTFSLYDDSTGGFLQWSEVHPSVQTKDGLFCVILGSVDHNLDASIFETEPLYLEIQVDVEVISPRTRLTSAPSAIRAKNMSGGDIETGPSSLVVKSATGDTGIVMGAATDKSSIMRLVLNNLEGDPIGPMVEMTSNPFASSGVLIHHAQPTFSGGIALTVHQSDSSEIVMYREGAVPHDEKKALGMRTSSSGSYFSMSSMDPGDDGREIFQISNTLTNGASIKMFNPQPEPPARIMEMSVEEVVGPTGEWESKIKWFLAHPPEYPTPKEILSIGSAPSTGASIKMFNPQMEQPNRVMEMSVNESADEWGGYFDMYSMDPGNEGGKIFEISNTASSGASVKMFNPQMEQPNRVMEMSVNESAGEWGSYFDMYSMDPADEGGKIFEISNTASSGASIKMFNPQPEPPAVIAEITGSYDAKGGSGQVAVYDDANHLYSVLAPAKLALSYAFGDNLGPPIFMEASASDAKVGIGTYTPSEELHVVGDICYTGSIGACSDVRYKKDVQTIGDAVETLLKLRGISYSWRQDEYPDMKFDDQTHLGFVAQEIKDLVPGVVLVDNSGNMSVDYGRITPLLVEAVKGQQEQIKELNAQIADLREALQKLELTNR